MTAISYALNKALTAVARQHVMKEQLTDEDLAGHDLTDAERAALAGGAGPAEEKPDQLPHGVQAQAARHHRIALEMAFEKPEIGMDVELSHHLALAGIPAILADGSNAVEHQHGW